MATVTETIEHIKDLTGQSNLSNAKGVRLINYGLDKYTYLALTADGKAQVDDSGNDDVNRATATLTSGTNKVQMGADFIMWSFVEIEDSEGNRWRLTPYDQRFQEETTPKTTDTGRPTRYDSYGGLFYFDKYADQNYTIRAHYSRAFNHVSESNLSAEIGIPSIHSEYIAMFASGRVGMGMSDSAFTAIRNEQTQMEREIVDFYRVRDEDMPQILQAKADVRR